MTKAPVRQPSRSAEQIQDHAVDSRVIGALLVTFGAGWLAKSTGAVNITWTGVLAAVLAALGGGMILTARRAGSSARLIAVGVVLTLALATTSVDLPSVRGGVGERRYVAATATDVLDRYHHFAGEMIINLSAVPPEGLNREIDVRITFGEVDIVVPDDMRVVVDYRMTGGEASILGRVAEGGNIRAVESFGPAGSPELRLRVRSTFGTIDIRRVSDSPEGWLRGGENLPHERPPADSPPADAPPAADREGARATG